MLVYSSLGVQLRHTVYYAVCGKTHWRIQGGVMGGSWPPLPSFDHRFSIRNRQTRSAAM